MNQPRRGAEPTARFTGSFSLWARRAAKGRRRRPTQIEALEARMVLTVPVAVADFFTTIDGNPLNVPAAGVLANDSDAEGDPLHAILVSNVSHGSLTLQDDGSFSYVPTPGYLGIDTFTYKVRTDPTSRQFAIDPAASTVTLQATLDTDFGGDSDSDSSRLGGTILTRLSPSVAPFSQIQVSDLEATLLDGTSLNFSFGCTIFGCLAGLNLSSDPNAITVDMVAPGAAASVAGNGAFSQTGNQMRLQGTLNADGTGLADGQVEGPQAFDSTTAIDFNGTIVQSGGTLTLTLPISVAGSEPLESPGRSVTYQVSGTIVATAPAIAAPEESATVTVTIDNRPQIDARADVYRIHEDASLAVVSPSVQLSEDVILPAGSLWRFLDNGSNQGVAWRAAGFSDTSWALGPAELGYNTDNTETPEATVVGYGPDAANKYVTTYFRRKITIPDPENISELVLNLKRDDGAVVYINGVEVVLDNLPSEPAFNTPALAAATDDGQSFNAFVRAANMLVPGVNQIAVEVHQSSGSSSDLSFDLEIRGRRANRSVLANDTDAGGFPLVAQLVTGTSHGALSFNADGTFQYTPVGNFAGTDSFVYRALESPAGGGLPRLATATIIVAPLNDAPAADADGPYSTPVGTPLSINAAGGVLNGDSDTEGNALQAVLVTPPATGSFTLGADGSFQWTPAGAASSSFTYRARETTGTVIVPFGAYWRIQDDGSDQGTNWRTSAFNDSSWWVGPGELGYNTDAGEPLEATQIRYRDTDAAAAGVQKNITSYFRHTFQVADASKIGALALQARIDDGAAFYLNGNPLTPYKLNAGALFNDPATATGENDVVNLTIDPALLVNGANVLAVEVHQQAPSSSDVSFDAQLTANMQSAPVTVSLNATAVAAVVGRRLFYNNSSFDQNQPAANATDDAAIATDKSALLPGGTATLSNYTSYSRGINGVMIDIAGLAIAPTSADFQFRVGNDNNPAGWAAGPAPLSATVRAGAGTGGSSRVTLVWADGAIKNQWLQVTAKASLGLAQADVFYFGNAVGETGNAAGNAQVNSLDEIATRGNSRSFDNLATLDFPFDFNRDGYVNATDQILARSNSTTLAAALKLIAVPAAAQGASAAAVSPLHSDSIGLGLAAPVSREARRPTALLVESAATSLAATMLTRDKFDTLVPVTEPRLAARQIAFVGRQLGPTEQLYESIADELVQCQF